MSSKTLQRYSLLLNFAKISIINSPVGNQNSHPNDMSLSNSSDLKLYYSISEVAAIFGVAESLLRYWEKQFPNIHPKKSGGKIRQYTQTDIDEIRVVYNLLKVRGMKINAAKEILSKNKKAAGDTSAIIDELQSLRKELVALRKELNDLM